jgi:chromosome segregation protein
MRLKYLELQGYKTFASRTKFVFDGGITAIVGPNGSGKSNIADAIRWVLGEQSYSTLRAKRTEDMIFSGSVQRSRVGMAQASLVLDNADGWLPIDFSEVTITRRAYRSGENEYLLNGSRVRLRDIGELLSKSGLARRTYTVIGQGLVDAVLSLRVEDRRELFEEASGIALYQAKRVEAVSRLEETRTNLLRINDIVHEITPRLRRLEREAERAKHHAMLTSQLEGLLYTWYGYRWHEEQWNLQRTRDALNRRETSLSRRREGLNDLDAQMAALRARHAQRREDLAGWRREGSDLQRRLEEVQRDLAVWRERARLLARQRDELQGDLAQFDAQLQVVMGRVEGSEQEASRREAVLQEKEALVAEAQAELDALEHRREQLSQEIAEARERSLDLAAQIVDRRNRLSQLEEQRASQTKEQAEHEEALASERGQAERLQGHIQGIRVHEEELEGQIADLEQAMAGLAATLSRTEENHASLQENLADLQRQEERLQARYELLSRLRAEGEGLHAGVRAVLQASTRLSGIVGTVAQHVQVPPEYEAAIEVALGSHLQDVVVQSWSAAEAAIAYLRKDQRGRATFLPLDTVRPSPRLEVPPGEGIVGLAADLVRVEERLAPVAQMLLGRTLVTHDLHAARQAFERLQGGFQIVSLAGEVLRSSGMVTGGEARGQVSGQVLAREREWRELPGAIRQAEGRRGEVEEALARALAEAQELGRQIAARQAQRQDREGAIAVAQAQRRELEQSLALAEQQVRWRLRQMTQLEEARAELGRRRAAVGGDLARLEEEKETAEGGVASLQSYLDELRGEALYRRLSDVRTEAAVARGAWDHRRSELQSLREQQTQLQEQMAAKRQRLADLDEEQASLANQIRDRASRESVIQGWLAALEDKIDPAEAELAELESEREQLEREETTLRARLRQAESSHSQALLAHSRQEDRLERLHRQIMDDFGLVEMEPTEGLPEQQLLPLGQMVSSLPAVKTLPQGLEDEIHQIKAQLRRMGAVNPNALDEYDEVRERHSFLTSQAADLEEAASGLREVIAELDDVMRREFQATFDQVATRFRDNFSELFGGGTAHLLLTDPDNISQTGVEIVARPPGKRQQTLALLSGGERSLTAVALIFAILEVSPPPFCVLDEVDAMLDEANVRRFRQALEALSQKTQFIIITHNRGTIEAANTIYGVSMGDDSVSKVVSLQLKGDRIAAPDGSAVEVKQG